MASVRVAVRVRPLNKREEQLSSKVVTRLEGNTMYLYKPSSVRVDDKNAKIFTYDFSYDSTDRGSSIASQEKIFDDLGIDVLKAAFEGFNACVFAYGQTGSGKSYTMMGHAEERGLIPRICEGLCSKISERSTSSAVSFRTEVSFMEIYNERVHDLLKKRTVTMETGGLRVREHPRDGPYVENLSKHLVHSYSNMEQLIAAGNTNRITASTGMNDSSSRSHAIFTISFTRAWFDSELPHEILSKIHLVDLAGSERTDTTRISGIRLKEGANINKSLVTLGTVISALAELSAGQPTTKKMTFIPYRDSVLTWLLKDSLGGNSKTTMIATISPANVNYVETLSTLRYANRARNIMNTPTVNEDSSVKLIRDLQSEITRLKRRLETKQLSHKEPSSSLKVEVELHQNEEKVCTLTKEWTCKWAETRGILQEEVVALKKQGSAVVLDCQFPHLIGIDEDLLRTGIVLYYLKEGRTMIHTNKASHGLDTEDSKPGLGDVQCVFENQAGTVTLIPQEGAMCSVNGTVVTHPCQMTQGAIIHLGRRTILRFNHPTEAAYLREKQQSALISMITLLPKSRSHNLSKMTFGTPSEVDLLTSTVGSKLVTCSSTFAAADDFTTTAVPGKVPVRHISSKLDGSTQQNGVSTRSDLEQEIVLCHKSRPELSSEHPWRKAENAAEVSSYTRAKVWSRDASLQQTSVLGPGDECVMKPEGNANEIQGIVAHCCNGRPGSGGSSLGNMSHLQHTGGTSFMPVPAQTNTPQFKEYSSCSPGSSCRYEETILTGQLSCGDKNDCGSFDGSVTQAKVCVGSAVQSSRLSALVNRVSWIVKDARHFLWSSSTLMQRFEEERKTHFMSHWSNHLISLVRESKVMSVIDSQVLSLVKGSCVFSCFKSSGIYLYSVVKELPLIQQVQMEIMEHLWANEPTMNIQDYNDQFATPIPVMSQTKNIIPADWNLDGLYEQEIVDVDLIQEYETSAEMLAMNDTIILTPREKTMALDNSSTVQRNVIKSFCLSLIDFPAALVSLQNLSLQHLRTSIQSVLSSTVLVSQKIVALFWLNVATFSQPEPCPALLVLFEAGLYTLTVESGQLVLYHQLPFLHLKEFQISFSGHGLRLMGTTQESILGLYTHSEKLTQEVCCAILGIMLPGDSRVSQHPLFNGDWKRVGNKLSLDSQISVPDLQLDAGLRVCCQFQRSLADLVYLLYCNMEEGTSVTLGELQLLMYTSVKVCLSSSSCTETVTQLLLTDTHIGLVQEDVVFYPTPRSVTIQPCHYQFRNLTLRQRADVRCMVVHDEDKCRRFTMDLIFASMKARSHPESVKVATPPALASNSSPRAEVWKLTFSCSTEAACLISYLSDV
ncbi:uncharacterized protein kif16bb isoform X2 [Phyllopteryx taeniolatus]|uniref:uncharacterized protein kif16bb isoform X2 n=1 Tax=Phyllopteryx taeniolatus TaxID=161469 RepID=UPI002AD2867A|nr:uncharacterized protein kif16bb isoform X2 [Phyllopteryx taeniolatus]